MRLRSVALLFGMVLSGTPSFAGEPPLTKLEISPASLKLRENQSAEVIVAARNASAVRLRLLTLQPLASPGIKVVPPKLEGADLRPGGSLSWVVQIDKQKGAQEESSVLFRLQYRAQGGKGVPNAPGVALGSVEIQDRPSPSSIEKVAEVRVESTLKLLQQYRPGVIDIIVKNKATFPITLKSVTPAHPDEYKQYAELVIAEPFPVVLDPQAERAFAVAVKARRRVPPGNNLFLFNVQLTWHEQGEEHTAVLVAKHEYALGVLGESEILHALALPTLLLLPGFLITTVFVWLWNRFRPGHALDLDVKRAEFWLSAVSVSAPATAVYSWYTRGDFSSFLTSYGLLDVLELWYSSIIVGAAACVLAVTGVSRWEWHWEWKRGFFSTGDAPLAVLRKLVRRGDNATRRPQFDVTFPGAPAALRCLLLQGSGGVQPNVWVAPLIRYHWPIGPPNAAVQALVDQHIHDNNMSALADLVKSQRNLPRGLRCSWNAPALNQGPREIVDDTTLVPAPGNRDIMEPEVAED